LSFQRQVVPKTSVQLWNANEDISNEIGEIYVPPFIVNFDASKSLLKDMNDLNRAAKYSEETWSLYMINRFNLGFYSHINIDQRT